MPNEDENKVVEDGKVVDGGKVVEGSKVVGESDQPEGGTQHDAHGEESHHDHHFADKHDIMPLFSPPKQRQRWGDAQLQPHTNWGDIFFDLFYVAAAYNLGNLQREDPTPTGLLYLVGCFLPIQGLWNTKMYYDSRYFVGDDMWHRSYEVAVLIVLSTAVLHIRTVPILSDPKNHVDMFVFCLSVSIGYILALGRLVEVMICQKRKTAGLFPEAFKACGRDSAWIMTTAAFYLAAAVYSALQFYGSDDDEHSSEEARRALADAKPYESDDTSIWLCIGGVLVSTVWMAAVIFVWFPKDDSYKKFTVPMNIDFCIHRFGEWTMLMLGESVLSLLIVPLSEDPGYYRTFYSGVISIILLEYLHFRSQPHDPDEHALRLSKNRGFIFSTLLSVYSTALVVLGTSYKMLLYEFIYEDAAEDIGDRRMLFPMLARFLAGGESAALRFSTEDRQQRIAYFFSGSMAIVWFCIDGMAISHLGIKDNAKRCESVETHKTRYWVFILIAMRVGLIAFIATVCLYVTEPDLLAFIGLCGILGQLVLRVLFGLAFPVDEEEEETKQIEWMTAHTAARMMGDH